jgi:putative oxidoreductase
MPETARSIARWEPVMRGILRIVTGFLFMLHGTQKLFGFPASEPREPVAIMSLMGLAGILEVFGGFLILIGLFTRPVAFLLAGEMAVAYFMAHAPNSFWPVLNQGESSVLFCFIFLFFMVAGAGALSVDSAIGRRRDTV